ncbi:MAG: transcriptional regulator, partial [Leclercia sp.]
MRQESCELRFDTTLSRQAWDFAFPLAYRFWESIAAEKRISANFRHIASGMATRLDEIREMVNKMA